jgi:hypothetical protein
MAMKLMWESEQALQPSSEPVPDAPAQEVLEGEIVGSEEDKPGRNPDGSYGRMDINEGMALLTKLLGSKPIKEDKNRIALRNLFRKRGKEATLERMQTAFVACRKDRFAPKVVNYMDLWDRWDDIDVYFERRNPGIRVGTMPPNAAYDNIIGGVAW